MRIRKAGLASVLEDRLDGALASYHDALHHLAHRLRDVGIRRLFPEERSQYTRPAVAGIDKASRDVHDSRLVGDDRELTPGVCGNDPHVDQAAPVVAVELAAQVLASRAGLGFDGVGEEIALHHFRLEHSPVGQIGRASRSSTASVTSRFSSDGTVFFSKRWATITSVPCSCSTFPSRWR